MIGKVALCNYSHYAHNSLRVAPFQRTFTGPGQRISSGRMTGNLSPHGKEERPRLPGNRVPGCTPPLARNQPRWAPAHPPTIMSMSGIGHGWELMTGLR